MDRATGRVVRSEADWRAVVEECEKSRQPASRFCTEQGIAYGCFLYHRGKILKKKSRPLAMSPSARSVPVCRPRGFIPVRVEESCGIRIRFPRGLVLESDQLPSAAWVVEVARRWLVEGAEIC